LIVMITCSVSFLDIRCKVEDCIVCKINWNCSAYTEAPHAPFPWTPLWNFLRRLPTPCPIPLDPAVELPTERKRRLPMPHFPGPRCGTFRARFVFRNCCQDVVALQFACVWCGRGCCVDTGWQEELRREIARLRDDVHVLRRSLSASRGLDRFSGRSHADDLLDYDCYDDAELTDWGRRQLLYQSQPLAEHIGRRSRCTSPGKHHLLTIKLSCRRETARCCLSIS